jgi:hypothetical protein
LARPIQWPNNHQSPEQSPVPRTITSPQQSLPKQPWPARRLKWSMHMPWPSEGRRSPRKTRVAITMHSHNYQH